jgi:hypothetical protein
MKPMKDAKGKRSIVTLDKGHDKFNSKIQKQNLSSMIKQMGLSKKEFQKMFDEMLNKKK